MNFSFIDSSFNKPYYREGRPDTEIAYMGCALKDSLITLKIDGDLTITSIGRAYKLLSEKYVDKVKTSGITTYVDLTDVNVTIYDSAKGAFVKCKKILQNPNKDNWYEVKTKGGRVLYLTADHPLKTKDRGRVLVKDLTVSDSLVAVNKLYTEETVDYDVNKAWLEGLLLCDGSYANNVFFSVGLDEKDIIDKVEKIVKKMGYSISIKEQNRPIRENGTSGGKYYDCNLKCGDKLKNVRSELAIKFGGIKKVDREVPIESFKWTREAKLALLAGMIDADGYIKHKGVGVCIELGSTNKALAYGQMYIAQAVGYKATITANGKGLNQRLKVTIYPTDNDLVKLLCEKKAKSYRNATYVMKHTDEDYLKILSIKNIDLKEYSYDVETESDMFDLCGVQSHNCRTRVIGNINDPTREVVTGRGNLSFTSINLPRLAIESKGDISEFFKKLDEMTELVIGQLL